MELRLKQSKTTSTASPRISVIIPARNDSQRLAKCLKALASSTFTDFETIVADDASTDQTSHVAAAMGARMVRLQKHSGAAAARNAAAQIAHGEILMFLDADVCVHADTLAVAAAALDDAEIDAVFGSYDLEPAEPNLLSQYKNLAHRFYHQNSGTEASTFWTGCGAIRKHVFNAHRFDSQQFTRATIEDIELGARLRRAGKRIVINRNLQSKHLKRWTLWGIIRSDLFDRAIPWTRVILRGEKMPADLNLLASQRIAALLAATSAAILLLACWFKPWLALLPLVVYGAIALSDRIGARRFPAVVIAAALTAAGWYAKWWAAAIVLPLAGVVLINAPFYRFFLQHRGWMFTATALAMHTLYYLYSIVGFAAGAFLHWRDTFARRLENFAVRVRLYVTLAIMLYLVSWGLVLARSHFRHTTITFAVSDAIGYYGYLPSLVIDHDLNFDNQVALQADADQEFYRRALRHNRWPIGVALTIAPAFIVAHGLSVPLYHWTGLLAFAPHGYSLLYLALCVAIAMAIGTVGMILLDRLIVQRLGVSGAIAAAAVLTTWLGTNYAWYFVREPLLTHMIGASWVICAAYLIHRIEVNSREGKLLWWHLPLLAFVTSMALVCRLTNALVFPLFVYLLVVLVRRGMLWRAVRLTPLILPALAPLALQAIMMRLLTGGVVHDDVQGMGYDSHERFFWTDPALFRTLFSSRHGLFFGTPALLLAAFGLGWDMLRRRGWRDGLVVSFAISAILLWYVNSAWYAWWFGPSVGNRAFVELAGLYGIGFALMYSWWTTLRQPARRGVVALLVFCFVVNYAMMAIKLFDVVEENESLIRWEDKIFTGRWERI